MSDPEAMRQVQSLGKQLGLGESTPAPPPAPVQSPVSGDMMAAFSKLAPLMNAAKPQTQQVAQPVQPSKPSVNLADGLDIGEIATLAGQFLGSNAAKPQAVPQVQPVQPVQQQASAGLDFGTIAQLASVFLKK